MIVQSDFKAAKWLASPHSQTIWPVLMRKPTEIALKKERLELPDGDFLDLVWTKETQEPLVIILHGLAGSIDSSYAKPIMFALEKAGFGSVFMHFRGCSGELNRKLHSYHAGETSDLEYLFQLLQQRFPGRPMFALGYSLGGNVLLKWLGQTGEKNQLVAAAAVSVPFELAKLSDHMQTGFARLYQWWLINKLRKDTVAKYQRHQVDIDLKKITSAKTFWQFDDLITAPVHGFDNATQYYQVNSSRQYLSNIAVNTLILHAEDDPFMTPNVIPSEQELSESVVLELSKQGGHVGFIANNPTGKPYYWLEKRIPEFFKQFHP